MSENTNPVHTLTEQECWDLLKANEFGRLAFHLVGEVHITPINYAVHEGTILFLTSEGSKLLGITMDSDVAFEVDNILPGEHAESVVVRGTARQLEGSEKYVIEQLPLRPWIPTEKHIVVEIKVSELSGRRFDLARPWTHSRPS